MHTLLLYSVKVSILLFCTRFENQHQLLLEKVEFDSVTRALNGQQGTQIERNASGEEMLNAYAPLNIPDVNGSWYQA